MGWVGTRSMREDNKGLQILVENLEDMASLARARTRGAKYDPGIRGVPGRTGFTWFRIRPKFEF
jgi:hypothetical protein